MEAKSFPALRRVPVVVWILLTAIAPIAWGSNYFVTREFLPQDNVLWGSVYRALPAGLMLLAVSRRLPTGGWWWKSVILGAVNVGAFFVLVYAAAQLLPASVASTVMAMSAATLMILAWPIVKEKPAVLPLAGALVGFLGVGLMVFDHGSAVNFLGIACSLLAMLLSSIGALLTKKWAVHQRPLDLTAWQLTAGGLMLIPVATVFEGPPSALDHSGFWASVYVCVVATAIAFFVWFQGLKHLSAATVGLIGLLNPVTGVLTGTLLAAETFGAQQLVGVVLVLFGVVCGFGRLPGRSGSRRALKVPRGLSKTSGVDCQM
ncbi:DMT family transporter [Glutamicibacter sp. NPDC087344]|uniref:DMT family transporter n=1 Tax=Glutamicibacter sp. NPDC087344 TaxID=3363994 RepID=UPI00381D7279